VKQRILDEKVEREKINALVYQRNLMDHLSGFLNLKTSHRLSIAKFRYPTLSKQQQQLI